MSRAIRPLSVNVTWGGRCQEAEMKWPPSGRGAELSKDVSWEQPWGGGRVGSWCPCTWDSSLETMCPRGKLDTVGVSALADPTHKRNAPLPARRRVSSGRGRLRHAVGSCRRGPAGARQPRSPSPGTEPGAGGPPGRPGRAARRHCGSAGSHHCRGGGSKWACGLLRRGLEAAQPLAHLFMRPLLHNL